MTAYERLLDRLTDTGKLVRPRGDGQAVAQCPAHDDNNPSLSLTRIEGSVLVHCHAGCSTPSVMDSLGLHHRDVFDDPAGTSYTYRDGRTVFRTYEDSGRKKFRQSGNTKGRDLYRVEKLEQVATGTPVYVVEGEKDVHAVESVGGVAVCSAMGAGKAGLFDWSPLAGHTVVIVADDDEPGRKHALQVHELVEPIAAGVVVATAKEGKDAADHIASGYGLDELEIVDIAGDPRPRAWKAVDLAESRRVEWLAKQRIVAASVNYMLGPEGIGKSMFLMWLTALITTGKPFPQFGIPERKPGIVVLVLTEDDWSMTARPRLEVAGADLDYIRVICAERDGSGSPVFPRDMDIVEEAAKEADVVIVDAWADTLPGNLSVKDPQQARQALHPWKELGTRTGAAVLLSGHTNREKGGNVRNSYGMTGELRKKARLTILAQPDPDDDSVMVIGPEKTNLAPQVPASRFRIESVQVFDPTEDSDGTVPRLVWLSDAQQSAREMFTDAAEAENGEDGTDRNTAVKWLKEYLTKNPGADSADVKKIAKGADIAERTLQRARKKLKIVPRLEGSPPRSFWELPSVPSDTHAPRGGIDGTDDIDAGQASMPPREKSISAICATPADTGSDVAQMPGLHLTVVDSGPATCPLCGTPHGDKTVQPHRICAACITDRGYPKECRKCGGPLPPKFGFALHHSCQQEMTA